LYGFFGGDWQPAMTVIVKKENCKSKSPNSRIGVVFPFLVARDKRKWVK